MNTSPTTHKGPNVSTQPQEEKNREKQEASPLAKELLSTEEQTAIHPRHLSRTISSQTLPNSAGRQRLDSTLKSTSLLTFQELNIKYNKQLLDQLGGEYFLLILNAPEQKKFLQQGKVPDGRRLEDPGKEYLAILKKFCISLLYQPFLSNQGIDFRNDPLYDQVPFYRKVLCDFQKFMLSCPFQGSGCVIWVTIKLLSWEAPTCPKDMRIFYYAEKKEKMQQWVDERCIRYQKTRSLTDFYDLGDDDIIVRRALHALISGTRDLAETYFSEYLNNKLKDDDHLKTYYITLDQHVSKGNNPERLWEDKSKLEEIPYALIVYSEFIKYAAPNWMGEEACKLFYNQLTDPILNPSQLNALCVAFDWLQQLEALFQKIATGFTMRPEQKEARALLRDMLDDLNPNDLPNMRV